MKVTNVRFIERDYYKNVMHTGSEAMPDVRIDKILDAAGQSWADLTFKFNDSGSVTIIDNHTDQQVPLAHLKGAAYDFYVKQRIRLIRANLQAKILQTA
ncbi:hypothetical protein ACFQI7_19625 [Paenibacillus allorhizosphaerae]|uniref:DUF1499 domain-containing protein n=1 Tax=Paenibacillus allorhizosphaerae TaxID=2849866 RepID=A0ABN7TR38_9BACL|nr:hypothetical protein [Paenibacillus allorhizosphaerae]CAG7652282.1 hypothetical protein PAECIP111802_05184 [Paenibacillus allorhizosphaerae]